MNAFSSTTTARKPADFKIEMIEDVAEESLCHRGGSTKGPGHYRVVWLTKGDGIYETRGLEVPLSAGSIFCLNAIGRSSIQFGNDPEGYIISFTEEFLKIDEHEYDLGSHAALFQTLFSDEAISIHDELTNELNDIIARLLKEYVNSFVFKTEMLRRYLKIFLIYLSRQFGPNVQFLPPKRNSSLVQGFLQHLEKNYRDKKMVTDYADMLFVTPNYLNEVTKKTTGRSAGDHIRQRIALEAKRMALSPGNSMKQIAYELGFLDCAHFSKFFKTTTGSNFSDFRKDRLTVAITISETMVTTSNAIS